ncbi:MAG: hypothetical protein Q4A00_04810 [Flavobacteriaceae bacterium]|nr:hypothetical protein [Flavobacteriaceae bacterium]
MNQKTSTSEIISTSLTLWKKGMKYNLLFSILYFGLLAFFTSIVMVYTGMYEKFTQLSNILTKNPEVFLRRAEGLAQTPEFATYTLLITICSGLVYPLHIGLMNVLRKSEQKEEVVFNDLLDGYNGMNFFKYASYYICWTMIYKYLLGISFLLGILLGVLWVAITLFIVPIMYFKGEPMGSAMIWSAKIFKENFVLVLTGVMVAFLFSYLGILLFGVGYLLTFPFWCAMIYVLYNRIFSGEIKTEN